MSEHSVIDHFVWMLPVMLWLIVAFGACFGAASAISRHLQRARASRGDNASITETGIERHWRERKDGWL